MTMHWKNCVLTDKDKALLDQMIHQPTCIASLQLAMFKLTSSMLDGYACGLQVRIEVGMPA